LSWDRSKVAIVVRLAFLSITLWVALTMVLQVTGPSALYGALDLPFHFLCHRMPERILSIGGVPMPMCSRCAGIWLGLSISAAAAWPPVSIKVLRVVFPIALVLMAIEVFTQDMGWHPVFHPTRILSGLLVSIPFGGALGALVQRELSAPPDPEAPPQGTSSVN
jgi:uncharacterized membrane protein